MKLNILIGVGLLFAMSCKEKIKQAEISGKVVNVGSGIPVDSALVYVKDGVGNSGPINFGPSSSNREAMVYTDKNGEFHLSIDGEYTPYISANKVGYDNYNYVIEGASIGYMPLNWGVNNIRMELVGKTKFCGVFVPRSNTDSLLISFLSYSNYKNGKKVPFAEGNNYCRTIGESSIMCFNVLGAINYCDGNYMLNLIGDKYLRINLDIKRDGSWTSKMDSVFLETGVVFKDTIYY